MTEMSVPKNILLIPCIRIYDFFFGTWYPTPTNSSKSEEVANARSNTNRNQSDNHPQINFNEQTANLPEWYLDIKPYNGTHLHFFITDDRNHSIAMAIRCCDKERIIHCIQLIKHNIDIVREKIYTISEYRGRDDYVIIEKNGSGSGYILINGIGTEGCGGDHHYYMDTDNLLEILNTMNNAL